MGEDNSNDEKKLIDKIKDEKRNKEKSSIHFINKGTVKVLIMAGLKFVPLIFVGSLIAGFLYGLLNWDLEKIKTDNTASTIYSELGTNDLLELVEIKGDSRSGYYLDFIPDIDEKLKLIVEDLKSRDGVQSFDNLDLLKKCIMAEVSTQFPNLGKKVYRGSSSDKNWNITSLDGFLFVGDSITVGMNIIKENEGVDSKYHFRCNGGDSPRAWLNHFENDLPEDNSVTGINVFLGTNGAFVDAVSTFQDFEDVIKTLHTVYPNKLIFVNKIFLTINGKQHDETKKYNQMLEQYCENKDYLICIDATEGVELDQDGTHPTYGNNGYKKLWSNIEDAILSSEIDDLSNATEIQQKIVEVARSGETFKAVSGECQAWICRVYLDVTGVDESRCCATKAWEAFGVDTSMDNIPIGACVYGESNPSTGCPTCGGPDAGHVGIYVGNGEVASNVGGISIEPLEQWAQKYTWKGWGWNGGKDYSNGLPASTNVNISNNNSNQKVQESGNQTGEEVATEEQLAFVEEARNCDDYGAGGGMCQAWMCRLHRTVFGVDNSGVACASEAWEAFGVDESMDNIPIGAAVYGHATGGAMCGGHEAGHVGVYLGNGEVASNVGGILIEPLEQWAQTYTWKGWGWHEGHDLSNGAAIPIGKKGATKGFQGSIKVRRITPDKSIGQTKDLFFGEVVSNLKKNVEDLALGEVINNFKKNIENAIKKDDKSDSKNDSSDVDKNKTEEKEEKKKIYKVGIMAAHSTDSPGGHYPLDKLIEKNKDNKQKANAEKKENKEKNDGEDQEVNEDKQLRAEDMTIQVSRYVKKLLEKYHEVEVVELGSTIEDPNVPDKGRLQSAIDANVDMLINIDFAVSGDCTKLNSHNGVVIVYNNSRKNINGLQLNMGTTRETVQLGKMLKKNISARMKITDETKDIYQAQDTIGTTENKFVSVTVMGGYLTGKKDYQILSQDESMVSYATGIADSILEYYSIENEGYYPVSLSEETIKETIKSKVYDLKYIPEDEFNKLVEDNSTRALNFFTLTDKNTKLITAKWKVEKNKVIIEKNSPIDYRKSIEKYIVPYEYLIDYLIDSKATTFVSTFADTIIDSEYILAIKDNVSTKETTTVQVKGYGANAEETSIKTVDENVSTTIKLTYADVWFARYYEDISYSTDYINSLLEDDKQASKDGTINKKVNLKGTITETVTESDWDNSLVVHGNTPSEDYSIKVKTITKTVNISYASGKKKTQEKVLEFIKMFKNDPVIQERIKPRWLFTLLERKERTKNLVDLTKFLLYKATGISYGVKKFDFDAYGLGAFNNIRGAGGVGYEWTKSFENDPLRRYMAGEDIDYNSTMYINQCVTEDRTQYIMHDDLGTGNGNRNYGFGVCFFTSGSFMNTSYFSDRGVDVTAPEYNVYGQSKIDVKIADDISFQIWQEKKDGVKSKIESMGIQLEDYQIDCLVDFQYQGCYITPLLEAYKQYGMSDILRGCCEGFTAWGARSEKRWKLFSEGIYETAGGEILDPAKYSYSGGGYSDVISFAKQFDGMTADEFGLFDYKSKCGAENVWGRDNWCAMFVSYCYDNCGLIPSVLPYSFAGSTDGWNRAGSKQENSACRGGNYLPKSGDIIVFSKSGDIYHVGLVDRCDGNMVYTVEGNMGYNYNTSPVKCCQYSLDDARIHGYINL